MASLSELIKLGKEMGYEAEPLQNFIKEQQELQRIEREKNRELEKLKIEAEEREKQREAEEREKQREAEEREKQREAEEREKQREAEERDKNRQIELRKIELDYELELKKAEFNEQLRSHSPGLNSTASTESTRRLPKLPVFVDGKDTIDSYLQRFERFATNQAWDKKDWATYLSALLSGAALEVYSRLNETDAQDYDILKKQLMKRYDLTEDGYRIKFRTVRPLPDESPSQLLVRITTYYDKWFEMTEMAKDWKSARNLAVREQFIRACPKELACHLNEQKKDLNYDFPRLAETAEQECKRKPLEPRYKQRAAALQEEADQQEEDNVITLDGKRYAPVACCSDQSFTEQGGVQPVKGIVNGKLVDVLRDTGCSTIIIKEALIGKDQRTGRHQWIEMADRSVVKAPEVVIEINSPYYSGKTKALALKDPLYPLLIGNIPGARCYNNPDRDWSEQAAITTRSQKNVIKKPLSPLNVGKPIREVDITRQELIKMQRENAEMNKYWKMDPINKGDQVVSFATRSGLLYRIYRHPSYNNGEEVAQIMVPQCLRSKVLQLAHDGPLAGHLGVKKTINRIQTQFYWPGMHGDTTRFCKSCDICQRTIKKGNISRSKLVPMPLIDTPFKRVAVDLVGPIIPASESGHRYILTLVDYTTRYPEAIPLKNISTEAVAEALLDMFSRLGIPEEILSDMGRQFTSDLMKEVSRLLQVQQLTTTPYHPMCNGLVERFNGTLKTMLKRLCANNPKQWNQFINAALFAYREVPQEATGFSPFELLYGRTVKGPMSILKQLWSGENQDEKTMTTYKYVLELRQKLDDMMNLAQCSLKKSQQRNKLYFDKHAKDRKFQNGDKVLVLLPTHSSKLLMQWKGPYSIIKSNHSSNNYLIRIMEGEEKTFHANLLKKYYDRAEDKADYALCARITSADLSSKNTSSNEYEDVIPTLNREGANALNYGYQLNSSEKEEVYKIVSQFKEVFNDIPGSTSIIEHKINLTSEEPIKQKPYPVPYALREQLQKDLDEMETLGIIQKSQSPYSAPIVLVPKPDGSKRICVDYQRLNKVTVFDPEPMATAEGLFQKLGKAKYFSKIDLSKGYWQIPVRKQDVPKTAFTTHSGVYEFLKMPFGMMNSGATFVRAMRKLLYGLKNVENYIDDILVYTETWEEHKLALIQLFSKLKEEKFTVKPSKCVIASSSLDFIGHHISSGELTPTQQNVEKVRRQHRPKTKKQIRSFLGLTGYYRSFIPNYSTIAAPLTDTTRKGMPNIVSWKTPQEKSFNSLMHAILTAPVLKLPEPDKMFILRTDASELGLGAVLMQEYEGILSPCKLCQ
ncbi:uncharacterized protein [Watersipora subatra]|uniref:uncharacterized protein n=1 Tax=Watersipora subatra TaxID=2589382 RepID=UPI00355ADE40